MYNIYVNTIIYFSIHKGKYIDMSAWLNYLHYTTYVCYKTKELHHTKYESIYL